MPADVLLKTALALLVTLALLHSLHLCVRQRAERNARRASAVAARRLRAARAAAHIVPPDDGAAVDARGVADQVFARRHVALFVSSVAHVEHRFEEVSLTGGGCGTLSAQSAPQLRARVRALPPREWNDVDTRSVARARCVPQRRQRKLRPGMDSVNKRPIIIIQETIRYRRVAMQRRASNNSQPNESATRDVCVTDGASSPIMITLDEFFDT